MDNIGIVVEDFDAAIEFFTELGLEFEGRTPIEGDWADDVTGLPQFSAAEKSYFWSPTPDEMRDWNACWFSTPVAERHSPQMPTPGWDYGSIVDAIAVLNSSSRASLPSAGGAT